MKFNLPKNSGMLPTDQHRALKNYRLMQWAKVATFGLYMVAVFMLYVSDVWGVASFVTQNSNEFIALTVFSIISFVLAFFLASSKEAVYEDIALHRSEGWKLKGTQYAAMGLFLSSGILFEMFSTTNNQQHIANTAAEQSTMMKSIQGTDVSLLGSANLTDSFASAKMKLAQCEARLAQGKEKHCDGAKARVDAVRESMTMANQLATTAAQQSVDNKVDGMLKIREHFDKPMFQAIGKATGTDNNSGMLMVIGVLIFIFECQHIMALFAYANSLARINRKVGNAGSNDNAGYASPTPFGTAPISGFANAAKQTVGEYAAKVEAGLKASPEIIATEYARADYANKQVLADAANMAEKIGDKVNEMAGKPSQVVMNNALRDIRTKILDSELQPTPEALYPMLKSMLHEQGFETPKKAVLKIATAMLEHLAMKDNVLVKNGNSYQLASRWTASSFAPESSSVSALHDGALYPPAPLTETDSFKQSPEQLAFVKSEYAKQMQEYERAKLSALSGENTVRYLTGNHAPSVPFHQQHGATGIHNPALGTEEKHFPLPLQDLDAARVSPCTVHVAPSTEIRASDVNHGGGESRVSPCTVHAEEGGKPFTESHYDQLKSMIVNREIEPTFRPIKTVLRGWEVGTSERNRQVIATTALDRMHRENVLTLNPANDGSGIKKAKYILA